jgi:glycosyltransferase involved in cell wall biosynthesis
MPEPNHLGVRSNKAFEYMAAGLPVIAPDFPAWRALMDETGAGVTVTPTDPAAIADAITTLLRDPVRAAEMGRRGRQAVRERYNWEAESERLLQLYARLVPRSGQDIRRPHT